MYKCYIYFCLFVFVLFTLILYFVFCHAVATKWTFADGSIVCMCVYKAYKLSFKAITWNKTWKFSTELFCDAVGNAAVSPFGIQINFPASCRLWAKLYVPKFSVIFVFPQQLFYSFFFFILFCCDVT